MILLNPRILMLAGAIALGTIGAPAMAAVQNVEVLERVPFADGTRFGDAGAYEKIRGVAHFAVDPAFAANATSSTGALSLKTR